VDQETAERLKSEAEDDDEDPPTLGSYGKAGEDEEAVFPIYRMTRCPRRSG
jgi:hypothetical protein